MWIGSWYVSGRWVWKPSDIPITWWPSSIDLREDPCMELENDGEWDAESLGECHNEPNTYVCEIDESKSRFVD